LDVIWGVSLLVFYPRIFLNRAIIYLLAYGLLLFIAAEIYGAAGIFGIFRAFLEFYQIAIGLSVITYFIQTETMWG